MKFNMKHVTFYLLGLLLVFTACETEETLELTQPEASFELIAPAISNINLNYNFPDNLAFTIAWNDDVTNSNSYAIEMDVNSLFESPIMLGTSTGNTFSMTVDEFNQILIDNGANAFEPFAVFMRVDSGTEVSNAVSFSVSAFAEAPPVIVVIDNTFSVVLLETTPDDEAINVSLEDPDFGGSSSAEVLYELQFAVSGTNFDPLQSVTPATDDQGNLLMDANGNPFISLTHTEFNDLALALGLNAEEVGSLDARIVATIVMEGGNLVRTSEVVTIEVTPFSVELAPILYVVGAGAADAGWSWDTPVELPLQGTKYSGNINLINDAFRFFEIESDWSSGLNYPYYEAVGFTIDSNLENANDGDSNFRFTGTPGQYFIEIDTEAKTITLGPPVIGPNCNFDQLWMVGAGVVDAGWSWDTPVALPCTGNGTYSGNVALTNDAFRFFTVNSDWGTGINYPTYEGNGYTIDAQFNNANDGDSNFFFNGTPGTYFITVDDINKTITVEPEQLQCEFEQLWLVGAGVVDAGWSWDTPVALPCTGAGIYSGPVALTNDAFRFFTVNSDWGTGINYPTYENDGYTIDSDLINANDGDSNFFFNGTPGTYTLTLNTVAKTITLE